MKTSKSAVVFFAFATVAVLGGCTTTNNPPPTAEQIDSRSHTIKRTYTQKDIQESGRSDTGEALQQLDPAVQYKRPR